MNNEIMDSCGNGKDVEVCDRPLITFILFAYNQESYICEAVEGALSQKYSPLEIILSDDCSADSTYLIMEQIAASYKGPHKIILNRNRTNLGIGAHFNRCMDLASGEFIVISAGDDISLPNRVMKAYQAWALSSNVNSVFSNLEKIDETGETLGPMFTAPPVFAKNITDFKNKVNCWAIGASFSFEKKLFSKYGHLDSSVRQEDGCLAFRALLEGQIEYLDEILVKYRHHGGNVSQSLDPARRLILQKNEYYMKRSWLCDAEKSGHSDKELIMLLKFISTKSYLIKMIFTLPLIGYCYNYLRIKTKLILKSFNSCRVSP